MKQISAWLAAAVLVTPVAAQEAVPRNPDATLHGGQAAASRNSASWGRGTVHYGKWATAAAAVALTALGAAEHRRSDRHWDRLVALCRSNSAECVVGSDGRYPSAEAESRYQAAVAFDRRARTRLLAGQAALLVTVGLFILDRRRGDDGPENIPFAPLEVSAESETGRARLGVRLRF
ncbi:MAG: hypothetical protein ACREL9_12715 [Gemmatimonadales bacterium]